MPKPPTFHANPGDPEDEGPEGVPFKLEESIKRDIDKALHDYFIGVSRILPEHVKASYIAGQSHAERKLSDAHILGDPMEYERRSRTVDYYERYKKMLVEQGASMINGQRVPWLRDEESDLRGKIADLFENAMLEGTPTSKVRESLGELWGETDNRLWTVTRTEMARAMFHGEYQRYGAAGVQYVEWLTGDEACEECEAMNHKVFDIISVPEIPYHPNCRCDIAPVNEAPADEDTENAPDVGRTPESEDLDEPGTPVPEASDFTPLEEAEYPTWGDYWSEASKIITNALKRLAGIINGGAGSGNYGHEGRPGEVGGSAEGEGKVEAALKGFHPNKAGFRAIAKKSEAELADALKGEHTGDNAPFDVIAGNYGIEVKTIIEGRNSKITMHKDEIKRKMHEARTQKLKPMTVVFDNRYGKLYYTRGVGAFRLTAMKETTMGELVHTLGRA